MKLAKLLSLPLLVASVYAFAQDEAPQSESTVVTIKSTIEVSNDDLDALLEEVQRDCQALVEKYGNHRSIKSIEASIQTDEETKCACGKPKSQGDDVRCSCGKPRQDETKCACGKPKSQGDDVRCSCGKPRQDETKCSCGKPKSQGDDVRCSCGKPRQDETKCSCGKPRQDETKCSCGKPKSQDEQ